MALRRGHFFLMLAVFAADRLSKFFAAGYLPEPVVLLPFLKLSFVGNTGVAFGLFSGVGLQWFLVFLSAAIIVFLLFYSRKEKKSAILCSIALIIAGAFGNLFDRIFLGSVVDFIDFSFWPAFNIADSAITVGVLLLLYHFWND